MNIVVYTANFGDKDKVVEIPLEKGVTYVYYTDKDIELPGWHVEVMCDVKNPRKMARYIKTHSHKLFPDADITIWKDARLGFKHPLRFFIDELADNDICFTKHPCRSCAYDEAEACKELKLDDTKVIDKQVTRYKKEAFPKDYGLIETGITIRKNTPEIAEFNELWWDEIDNYSIRDQISCTYCLWKLGIKYSKYPRGYMIRGSHKHAN